MPKRGAPLPARATSPLATHAPECTAGAPWLHRPSYARAQYMGRCPAARIHGVRPRLALAACSKRRRRPRGAERGAPLASALLHYYRGKDSTIRRPIKQQGLPTRGERRLASTCTVAEGVGTRPRGAPLAPARCAGRQSAAQQGAKQQGGIPWHPPGPGPAPTLRSASIHSYCARMCDSPNRSGQKNASADR